MKFSPAFPPTIPPPTTTISPDFVDVLEFSESLYQTTVPARLTMTAYPTEDAAPRKRPRLSASEELQLPPGYRFVPSDIHSAAQSKCSTTSSSNNMRLNDWVLCKIYKKPTKSNVNYYKNHSGRNVECTSPLSRDSSAPPFHSPDIPDNEVDDSVAIQPVYTTATNGITYSGSEMMDPPLGFEDFNAWNMPEMVDPPLGFEDDDKWNISDLCIEGCNHQSMGTLEDIVTPPTNLLEKRRKETLRVE
ncbi:hypothetical protein EZV62_003948 [Acer yangbiense]|uniref:NAC domain-containing protein n=1 Tax=Acer yangbiense TaxID=1000413 RepID=A0A5C7IIE8_9ROSI|nr:hypothetical protein EZV62_003948 [Acer yangbiense]